MRRAIRLLVFICTCFLETWCQPYIITTVAGTDRLLDGSMAINVPLRDPHIVVVDGGGNFYIADTADNRVRKVSSSGTISTLAGTGLPGFGGDRGKASLAQLDGPVGLAIDSASNIYVADRGNRRVRRISSDGIINTVAGNGSSGTGGDNGPALSAPVTPLALAVDNQGNLYISTYNFQIRKVDSKGVITTIAGTGTRGYFGDNGPANIAAIDLVTQLAVDSSGNLYLADFLNDRVRKIDASGKMTTVAGSGFFGLIGENVPAVQSVMLPDGVALDAFGNLYLSDVNRNLVRKVSLTTGAINTVAGMPNPDGGFSGDGDQANRALLNFPAGLAIDSMNQIYVVDLANKRVRRIASGIINTVAGTGIRDGGPATSAFLSTPEGLAVDGMGNVAVADAGNSVLRRFAVGGNINTFGQLKAAPTGVAVDQGGNFYATDDEPFILKITAAGVTSIVAGNGNFGYTGDNGPATSATLGEPTGVAVDAATNVYFTDFDNNHIRKVAAGSGTITTIAGNGKFVFSGDNGPALSAAFDPYDVAVDNRNNLYIADRFNNRVRKIAPDGTITTVVGTGVPGYSGDGGLATNAMIAFPTGVAVDNAGNLYVCDNGNSVVRRVTAGGLITTIAGSGDFTPISGDGGLATAARLDPWRIAVDSSGNLYVTDSFNDRVRKLTPKVVANAAMSIVSGNNQSGTAGTQLSLPLVVKITDSTGAGVPGVIVNFTVNPAGAATLNPSPTITVNDGTARARITLGNAPGTLTVIASATGVPNVSFSATALPPVSPTAPVISHGGVVGAGLSFPAVTKLAPNGIATIFGDKFAPPGTSRQVGQDDLVDGKVPTNLAGVCAVFGVQRAPILGVYPGQLNVQVPQLAPGNTTVQVINKCDTPQAEMSNAEPVSVQSTAPEFFYFVHNGSGHNPIAALNATTGAYIGAPGLVPGGAFTPAKTGDLLSLFATAFGATDPPFAPGVLPGQAAQVTAPVSITFGGIALDPSDILYVGVTQNAGLYQVNLRVPPGVPDGDQPVVITVGGVSSPAGGFITVNSQAPAPSIIRRRSSAHKLSGSVPDGEPSILRHWR